MTISGVWTVLLLAHVSHGSPARVVRQAGYSNVALDASATQSSTGGGAQLNMYLSGYAGGRRMAYKTLAEALTKCKTTTDCGGVTKERGNNYTLRRGTKLKKSPSGETSWLIAGGEEAAGAARAVDGNKSQDFASKSCTMTASNTGEQWWEVDVGKVYKIDHVMVYGRTDTSAKTGSIQGAEVYIGPHLCVTLVDSTAGSRVQCTNAEHMIGQRVRIKQYNKYLTICEVIVNVKTAELEVEYSTVQPIYTEVAQGKPTSQSTTAVAHGGVASRAVDGKTGMNDWNSKSCTHTDREALNWWQVDLEAEYPIERIEILGRNAWRERLDNAMVLIDGHTVAGLSYYEGQERWTLNVGNRTGRVVRITNLDIPLTLCEVQVFVNNYYEESALDSMTNLALKKRASSSSAKYGGTADLTVDGNADGNFFKGSCMLTAAQQGDAWWRVELGMKQRIGQIQIYARLDSYNHHKKNSIDSAEVRAGEVLCGTISYSDQYMYTVDCGGVEADRVTVTKLGILSICEVMVYAPVDK